jgi:hypothetical protein
MFLFKVCSQINYQNQKQRQERFYIKFDFFNSYDLTAVMGIFKDNSEVFYRSDFDKKNKADIRTLVLEKNARDMQDKKIHNRIIVALVFCLIAGLALTLIK